MNEEEMNKNNKKLIEELGALRKENDLLAGKVRRLENSEEKFRSIFESSNDALILADENGFLDCNDAALKIFACESREEFCGRHPADLSPPKQADGKDSRQAANERVATAFREGRNFFECIYRRANGEEFPAEVLLTPLKLGGGKAVQATLRDITERKKAEASLQEAHEELKARVMERTAELNKEITEHKHTEAMATWVGHILEDSLNEIYIFDAETLKFIQVNRGARENLRYSIEELRNLTPLDIKPEFSHDSFVSLLEPLRTGKKRIAEFNTFHRRKDGTLYPVIVNLQLASIESSPVFVAIILDVTERKKAEEALQTLVTGTMGGTWQEFFNNMVESLANWLKADCVLIGELADGGNVEALAMIMDGEPVPWFSYPLSATPCEKVTENGFCVYPEGVSKIFPDDRPLVEMGGEGYVGTPLKDSTGTPIGVLCAISRKKLYIPPRTEEVMDIIARRAAVEIERKRSEIELEKSEQNYRKLWQQFKIILDAIPDSLMLLNPDLTVQWSNKKGKDPVGLKCHQLLASLSQTCRDCPVLKSFKTGIEEENLVTIDGKIWHIRALPVMDSMGRVQNVLELANDVSEKISLRQEAMRAGHLASLGELAAGVAHEINNPINSIINFAQILSDEHSAADEESDICDRIIGEGKRISAIVKSLLTFARKSDQEKRPAYIGDIVSACLTLTEKHLEKENISLKVDIPPDLPRVLANFQQLQQVVINIINNARYALNKKYPEDGKGKVFEIWAKGITLNENPYLRITFRDQGTGIPSGMTAKVVEPFFSTKPEDEGTGLGLSISHGIINEHRGKMSFNSIEGEFTEVIVDLPAMRGS